MKIGDMVTVIVPGHAKHTSALCSTQGIIIDWKDHDLVGARRRHRWWYVMRNDNGRIEKFHENWCEVIDESR